MSARRLDAPALRRWAHAAVARPDQPHRRDQPAQRLPGRRRRHRHEHAVHDACGLGAGRCARRPATTSPQVAAALADGALRGARGNSGVILSQILRGLADVTAAAADDRDGVLTDINGALFGAALRHAVTLVVASMGEAVPGTIVSVLQDAADAAEQTRRRAGATCPRSSPRALEAAAAALDRTPSQLDVLAEAGVVDAGGRGLLVLLDALTADARPASAAARTSTCRRRSRPRPWPPTASAPAVRGDVPARRLRRRRRRDAAGPPRRTRAIRRHRRIGLRGGPAVAGHYSVHVHADDAGAAVEAGLAVGTPSRIQITSLSGGADRRPAGGWSRERAVLAVVDGDGAEGLFAGEGAAVLRPEPDVADQRAALAACAGQHRCRAGDGAAERVRRGRGTGRRLRGRHRLGDRPGAGAHRIDGAGPGRTGRPRRRAAGRSTTATPWPGRRRAPATGRCGWPPRRR